MGRIRIGKSMSQFSLKVDADANLWDTKAGRMTGKSHQALKINQTINRINLIIHTRYKELCEIHSEVNPSDLKNASQGIASTQPTVLDSFRTMNDRVAERIGKEYSQAAFEQYLYAYKALEGFIHQKLKLKDIPFKMLNYSYIENYYEYLLVDRQFSIRTSGIYLIYFRKIVRSSVRQGILPSDPFHGFEAKMKDPVHKTLTKQELERFMSHEPQATQQKKTKDIFVFAVFTGLSYIDMKNLTYDKIHTMEDGRLWIVSRRQKTGIEYRVRLLDIPLAIIEKYRGQTSDGKVLDVPHKKTVHAGLNAIAKRCGINTKLGIHCLRHTSSSFHLTTSNLQNHFHLQVTI